MKVLHVTASLGVGGTEVQLRSMVQHSRHECEVLALFSLGSIGDLIREDGIPVGSLGMTGHRQMWTLPRLCRLMRDGHYDVVHAHNYQAQIIGRPAARLAGIPVVVSTEHSIGEARLGGGHRITRGFRALYVGTEIFSDMTIAVSQAVSDRLLRWGVQERKLTVIPNGVDLGRVAFDMTAGKQARAELGINADDFVFGVLGRLDANKRVGLVIEATAPLLRPGVTLLIVGDGDERARLEETADRCGAASHVVFAGERNDVGPMLSAMDLLAASSQEETFGLSVVEALANGLPVLYTTSPALDGLNVARARRVPGTVAGIRDAMTTQLATGRRERAPEPAVETEYNIQAVVARIDDLYERLASRRSAFPRTARAPVGASSHLAAAPPAIGTATTAPPGPRSADTAGTVSLRDRTLGNLRSDGAQNGAAEAGWPGAIFDGRLGQADTRQDQPDGEDKRARRAPSA
jgi:glycosyltransferase involved in cell wall biosynthesis